MASILQSGKRRRGARGICASIALAARKKPLLRDEHDHAADWLHCSVCKNKCMLLCMLVSFNECVSASTRRETSHIDSPLRLAARGSRTPMPCSAASASSAVRILSSGAKGRVSVAICHSYKRLWRVYGYCALQNGSPNRDNGQDAPSLPIIITVSPELIGR